nr:hypothetical protein [Rhodothermus marinus]
MLVLNRWYNHVRRRLGLSYWSLSAYLKYRTKRALQYIADFERAVVAEARKHDVEGVVCGHIHHASCAKSAAFFTPTRAIGWKAARPWWSTSTDDWKSCTGRPPRCF